MNTCILVITFDTMFGIHNEWNSCKYLKCKDHKPTYFHICSSCIRLAFPYLNELSCVYVISFDHQVCIMKVISKQRIYEHCGCFHKLFCSSYPKWGYSGCTGIHQVWPIMTGEQRLQQSFVAINKTSLCTCMAFITAAWPSQPQITHTKNVSCDFQEILIFQSHLLKEACFHGMNIFRSILHILKALMGKDSLVET